jgi:hypothetical protein
VIVVTNVKIVNKPINNLTGVFSGVTRTIGDQNWSSNPEHRTLCIHCAERIKIKLTEITSITIQ